METIMLFRRVRDRDDQLVLRRGNRTAVVCAVGGAWQWTVYGSGGLAVAGRRSFDLDALAACDEAYASIITREVTPCRSN